MSSCMHEHDDDSSAVLYLQAEDRVRRSLSFGTSQKHGLKICVMINHQSHASKNHKSVRDRHDLAHFCTMAN